MDKSPQHTQDEILTCVFNHLRKMLDPGDKDGFTHHCNHAIGLLNLHPTTQNLTRAQMEAIRDRIGGIEIPNSFTSSDSTSPQKARKTIREFTNLIETRIAELSPPSN